MNVKLFVVAVSCLCTTLAVRLPVLAVTSNNPFLESGKQQMSKGDWRSAQRNFGLALPEAESSADKVAVFVVSDLLAKAQSGENRLLAAEDSWQRAANIFPHQQLWRAWRRTLEFDRQILSQLAQTGALGVVSGAPVLFS